VFALSGFGAKMRCQEWKGDVGIKKFGKYWFTS